ncbi:unnamed protein product, partial [Sphacelaria rigidula]
MPPSALRSVLVTLISRVQISPTCTLKSLNALRALSFCSVMAVFLLTVFIGIRAVGCACTEGVQVESINLWPQDGWAGALQAIPIYICAFACHFNVLPVHGELAKPTRERLHRMV